jgi:hypothetical protein
MHIVLVYIRERATGNSPMRTEVYMKAIGRTTRKVVTEGAHSRTASSIMDHLRTV